MNKTFVLLGCAFAALGVIIGAFGAHGLTPHLEAAQLKSFETGVKYQMYHAIALILLGIIAAHINSKLINYSGVLFALGISFFSGSIYMLSTRALTGLSVKWLGPITPIGGTMLIMAWILLFIAVLKSQN